MTLQQCAALMAGTYPGGPDPQWDHFYDGRENNCGIVCAVKYITLPSGLKAAVIPFRGSLIREDWRRDFQALQTSNPKWGKIHPGFYKGIPDLVTILLRDVQPPYILEGHSLGGARVKYAAAEMIGRGVTPIYLVTWREPRAGGAGLADVTKVVPGVRFRALDSYGLEDNVTDYPLLVTGLEDYQHDRPPTDIMTIEPKSAILDREGPFGRHHFGTASSGYWGATPNIAIPI